MKKKSALKIEKLTKLAAKFTANLTKTHRYERIHR